MKNALPLCLFFAVFAFSTPAFSQHEKELAPGYYVVVGAYAQSRENIAQNYVEALTRRGLTAEYGFNTSRSLFFVYLKYYDDLRESLRSMQGIRKQQPEFSDAWVRVVPGDVTKVVARQNPATATPVKAEIKPAEEQQKIVADTQTASPDLPKDPTDTIAVTDNPEIVQYPHITLGNTEVFLSLYNGTNNRIVDGEVKVIDTERTRFLSQVRGNEYMKLPDPKSKTGQLTLIAEVFGYRKIQQEINYPLPLADTIKEHIDLMGTTFVINFDMVRYHKGDISTLYNVYFYNDASVMLPESKYELNSLLQMMQENKNYRIRLHGHSNGNYHGKIISMGPSRNFFALTEDGKNSVGSAKELSQQRAETIKEFLMANGIAGDRIEVKAWGGKRPLYDKHSVNAKRNVRVEVEILQE